VKLIHLSVQQEELSLEERGKSISLMQLLASCGPGTLACRWIRHRRSVFAKNDKKEEKNVHTSISF